MSILFDRGHCTGCGLCIPVCPEKRFVQQDKRVEMCGSRCMLCGHCQAACPVAAIEIEDIQSELNLQHIVEKKGNVPPGQYDSADLVQLMRSRRSCRNYQERGIDSSLLEDLVRIGTTAPSGTNSQGWSFVILPTRQDVEIFGDSVASFYQGLNRKASNPLLRLFTRIFHKDSLGKYYRRYWTMVEEALSIWRETGEDRLFHGAVAAIVVCGNKTSSCPAEDALLATQNILLAGHALGLGTCLIGFAVEAVRRDKKLKDFLQLTPQEEIYAVIGTGYPDEHYCLPAGRKRVQPRFVHAENSM